MATNDNNIENKIIETAQQLFVKNGFTDTNMSDIAAAVGIVRLVHWNWNAIFMR